MMLYVHLIRIQILKHLNVCISTCHYYLLFHFARAVKNLLRLQICKVIIFVQILMNWLLLEKLKC